MLFQGRLDRDEIWSNSFGVFTSLDSISYPLPFRNFKRLNMMKESKKFLYEL